jgi:hypothetical protein
MSSVASDDLREAPPDASPILSQWRRLASMDQQSPDFIPLLLSLTSQDKRSPAIKLSRADAKATLDIMDQASLACSVKAVTYVSPSIQVFKDDKIPREYKCNTIYTMRKLAYSSRHVPASYQVDRASLNMEMTVIACGAFADVRKGTLGERAVAIRTLRVDQQADKEESEKVRVALVQNRLSGRY